MARQLYYGCEPGQDVMDLQDALNAVQADASQASAFARLLVDGHFGTLTQSRVTEFQKLNRLGADGVVGTQTWQCLRAALQGIPGLRINRPVGGGGTGSTTPPGKASATTGGSPGKTGQAGQTGKGGQGGKSGDAAGGSDTKGSSTQGSATAGGGKTGAPPGGGAKQAYGAVATSAFGGAKAWTEAANAGKGGGGKGSDKSAGGGGKADAGGGKADPGPGGDGSKGWTGKGGGMVAAAYGAAHWSPAFSGQYKPPPASGKDSNTKSDGGKSGGKSGGGDGGGGTKSKGP